MDNKPGRSFAWFWPVAAAAVIIIAFAVLSRTTTPSRNPIARKPASTLDLVGMVKSADGQPLTNASLYICSAGPRQGPGFT